jgi:nucleotide-binding universal stress UspA family protein
MVEVKKILFPVDFFESSNKILPVVKLMAEKLGAKIELVHVVRGSSDFVGYEMGTAWYYMIIIGTHGRKGLDKIMFGSVAKGVVKGAHCPVLTVNPYKVGK